MGLDMYLWAEKYVSGFKHSGRLENDKFKNILAAAGLSGTETSSSPSARVSVNVVYWRKANQIHNWFVKNVQGGVDECQPAYVEREQLEALLALCEEVKKDFSKAESLLPTGSGFFFGSTEYGDDYRQDIEHTISSLTSILNNEQLKDCDFYYQSSW